MVKSTFILICHPNSVPTAASTVFHLSTLLLMWATCLQATNGVWIPWNMLYIGLYEQFKQWEMKAQMIHKVKGPDNHLPQAGSSNVEGPTSASTDDLPPWALAVCSAGR